MAAKYLQKFASTAELIARAADRSLAAGIGVVSGIIYGNVSGSAVALVDVSTAQTLTNKTLTSPAINTPTITSPVVNGATGTAPNEVVAATNVILAAESGTVYFLSAASEFVSTLPAPAAGLRFTFIIAAAPSGASYTVVCNAAATIISGHVLSKDLNAGTDSGSTAGTPVGTLTFVDGKSIVGDKAVFECDGTNWYVVASTGGTFDAITLS